MALSEDRFYSRGFLNPQDRGGVAAYEAKVGEVSTSHAGERHFDAELSLGDCTRTITLDFGCWGEDRTDEIRTKAKRLKRMVDQFTAEVLRRLDEVEG